jgi:hypothetical protein
MHKIDKLGKSYVKFLQGSVVAQAKSRMRVIQSNMSDRNRRQQFEDYSRRTSTKGPAFAWVGTWLDQFPGFGSHRRSRSGK